MPFEKKIIYRRYQVKELGFYWLMAELDPESNLAFGYANLNDDQMAEWGYISMDELIQNHAELDKEWKPCTYQTAMLKIMNENR